ncbi:MAG: molybdopterin-guanine dinucleotide biosynthesis protein B [Deltaproteobacteria bacterium]
MNVVPLPDYLPVLGICGFSDSGKTTLIEQAIPLLLQKKLRLAVVKHDAHRVDCDRPGKDSDRFFQAGADVYVNGDQSFSRGHPPGVCSFQQFLVCLACQYDLVLVEGYKHSPLPKIWLTGADHGPPPDDLENLLAVYPRDSTRLARLCEFIDGWLETRMRRQPLYACILLGGQSRRMGTPKHLLTTDGWKTWLQKISEILADAADRVFLAGTGAVPDHLRDLPRFPDIPHCSGPLSGIISVMRWQPTANWLVVGCDMPLLSLEAVRWLLGQRRPGLWGTMPMLDRDRPEPLLALYDGRLLSCLEDLTRQPLPRITLLADHEKISRPIVPDHLKTSWTNINTPEELARLSKRK